MDRGSSSPRPLMAAAAAGSPGKVDQDGMEEVDGDEGAADRALAAKPPAAAAHPHEPAAEEEADKDRPKDFGVIAPPEAGCPLDIDPQRFFTMMDNKSKDPAKARELLDQFGRLEGLLKRLQSSANGVADASVPQRQRWLGKNALPPISDPTFCDFLIESFDEMMMLLSVLGVTALIIQLLVPESGEDDVKYETAWIDGTFILVAVTLVVLITSINNYRKEQKFRELDAISDRHDFKVMRQGNPRDAEGRVQPVKIDHTEIVVGDVVMLQKGDLIPADGVFISGGTIVDESALTGENDLKEKAGGPPASEGAIPLECDPFVISGTSVTGGSEGMFLVCAVGERSYSGHLEMGLRKETPPTPLQEKLDELAGQVGWLGIIVAVVLFVVLGVCNAIRVASDGEDYDARVLLDYAIISVSIIVVAVPEGLPLSVTIALAYSMSAMQKDNNMVRSLMACETMGAATNICSDKTGTLTQNEMIMTQVNISKVELQKDWKADPARAPEQLGSAESDAKIKCPAADRLSKEVLHAFVEAALYNSEDDTGLNPATEEETRKWCIQQRRANKSTDGPKGPDGAGLKLWGGNKTEVGIVRWCRRVWPDLVGSGEVTDEGWERVRDRAKAHALKEGTDVGAFSRAFPHDTIKKSSTTVVATQHGHDGCASRFLTGRLMQFTKGAPERILKACGSWVGPDNTTREMTPEDQKEFEEVYARYSEMALRGIAVAYCELEGSSVPQYLDEFCDGKDPYDPDQRRLTLLGICGIQDPPREEVPEAVSSVQLAGVTVRMCTGDNTGTGTAIAQECGLVDKESYLQWKHAQTEREKMIEQHGREQGQVLWQQRKDLPQKFLAMTGSEFRAMFAVLRAQGDAGMKEFYERLRPSTPGSQELGVRVLARCTPLEKQLFVGSLMMLGEVVAVTGDGCNDAPALKLADVGFAMEAGHQVAKKASKIVLLDNNFVSVVKACKWGRNVNDSIRKFLQFQFTVNIVLLTITFIGAVADVFTSDKGEGKPPLAAIHLLWANLIMDTMAAMALSTERPHDNLISAERKPVYRQSPLLSRKMWRFIIGGAIYQLAVTLTLIFAGKQIFDVEDYVDSEWWSSPSDFPLTPHDKDEQEEEYEIVHRTITFNIFIYMQVFNWFSARKLFDEVNIFEGFCRSPMFLPIVAFTAGFQAFMVEVAGSFLETKSIGAARWGICIGVAFLMWPVMAIVRLIPVDEAEVEILPLDKEVEQEEKEKKESGGDDDDDDDEEGAGVKLKQILEVFSENEQHYHDEQRALKAAKEGRTVLVNFKCVPQLPGYMDVAVVVNEGAQAAAVWRDLLSKLPATCRQRKFLFTLADGAKTEAMRDVLQCIAVAKLRTVEYSCDDEYDGAHKTVTLLDKAHIRPAITMELYESMPASRLVGQLRAALLASPDLEVYNDGGVMARSRRLRVDRASVSALVSSEGALAQDERCVRIVGEIEGWKSHGLQPGVYISSVETSGIESVADVAAALERHRAASLTVDVVHVDEDSKACVLPRLHASSHKAVPAPLDVDDASSSETYHALDSGDHTYVTKRREERHWTTNARGVYQGWFTGGKMPSKWAKPPSKYLKKADSLRNPISTRRRSVSERAHSGSAAAPNEPAV